MQNQQSTTALAHKIDELFAYRKLPYLISTQEPDANRAKKFLQQLSDLQTAIYHLDAYLESNWDIDEQQLDAKWVIIYEKLSACGLTKKYHKDYVSHIQKYQKHELQLREGLLPTRLSMEYFYYYKSCDVKLIRRLIYDRYPALAKLYTLGDWRYFDRITEVDDDVSDIHEDQHTINGNRFLITIKEEGIDEAKSQFSQYMKGVRQRLVKRFDQSGDTKIQMKAWCLQEWEATMQRLREAAL